MKTRTKIITITILGGALSFALPFLRSDWSAATLCDGFSLVGVLLLSYGGLLFLLKNDAFFGVRFIMQRLKSCFFPFWTGIEQPKKTTAKRHKEREGGILVLFVGLGYFAVALIFLFFV